MRDGDSFSETVPEVEGLSRDPEDGGGGEGRDHFLLQLELGLRPRDPGQAVQADVKGSVVRKCKYRNVQDDLPGNDSCCSSWSEVATKNHCKLFQSNRRILI